MSRRSILLLVGLFLAGALLGAGWQLVRRPSIREKELFLPEAKNDFTFAVVSGGEADPASQPEEAPASAGTPERVMGIETRVSRDCYPVGTTEIELTVINHTTSDLLYSEWFDFRRFEEGEVIRLIPIEGSTVNPAGLTESERLKGGDSIVLTVPIDLFDPPLGPGIYRVAQLACYGDTGDHVLACTEISAEFRLE